ncbi:hypothetical protein AB0G04_18395 [Actinoplanes sp. NPDC023801]|uniref:hypothetical protein n=1 Tax=Actinoplanes sp. NPDC023801 TaxID=3154595 RepID=UPI0033C94FF1
MAGDVPVASQVVRRVLTRAIGDAEYKRTLLENPDEVMRTELARAGEPVPAIDFDVVEETATKRFLRVPVSRSEREAQTVLQPLFTFVDTAGTEALERFVRAPKAKLEELFDVDIDPDIDVVVRIEREDQRVLVIPWNEFGAISSDKDRPDNQRIKLCPKGVTVDLCPEDVTIADICPADCTFTHQCPCTISNTDTGAFCTIQKGPTTGPSASVQKTSDLLDE